MAFWLLKSEPSEWAWEDQIKHVSTTWDGIKNPQALQNLKCMKNNDKCFFYHTGAERAVVGIVKVIRTFYLDSRDKKNKIGCVDVKTEKSFPKPVTLSSMKQEAILQDSALIRQGRLSVVPVPQKMWRHICRMGGIRS